MVVTRSSATIPPKYRKIVEFNSPEELEFWEVATDRSYGGQSVCSFGLEEYGPLKYGCFTGLLVYRPTPDLPRGGFATFRNKVSEEIAAMDFMLADPWHP